MFIVGIPPAVILRTMSQRNCRATSLIILSTIFSVSCQVITVDGCPHSTHMSSEPTESCFLGEEEKYSKNWLTVANFNQLSM